MIKEYRFCYLVTGAFIAVPGCSGSSVNSRPEIITIWVIDIIQDDEGLIKAVK